MLINWILPILSTIVSLAISVQLKNSLYLLPSSVQHNSEGVINTIINIHPTSMQINISSSQKFIPDHNTILYNQLRSRYKLKLVTEGDGNPTFNGINIVKLLYFIVEEIYLIALDNQIQGGKYQKNQLMALHGISFFWYMFQQNLGINGALYRLKKHVIFVVTMMVNPINLNIIIK